MRRALAIVFVVATACRGEDSSAPPPAEDAGTCEPGFEEAGAICVAQLDTCDDRSIAREGGGCEPVGVRSCAAGFRADGHGGCAAIVPESPCEKGTMAIPGETACRPVSDCVDPWGGAPASAMHVDAAASPVSADGSLAHPFATIGAALATGASTIAVAAGTYAETLTLDREVMLIGRCPSMVEIRGDGVSSASIAVSGAATLRGLGISGLDVGIDAMHGFSAESVWIHDVGVGLRLVTAGDEVVTVTNALVEHTRGPGVRTSGGKVSIAKSTIRDSTSTDLATLGTTIAGFHASTGAGSLSVADSVIENGVQANVLGCTALTIERTLLRGGVAATDLIPSGGVYATGCTVPGDSTMRRTKLVARDLVIERTIGAGVQLLSADATLERITVHAPQPALTGRAIGIIAENDVQLQGTELAVDGAGRVGIALLGTEGALDHLLVRDTRGEASDGSLGIGLAIVPNPMPAKRSNVAVRAIRVARSHLAGIAVVGSTASIDGCLVEDTQPEGSSKAFGDGLAVTATKAGEIVAPAELTVSHARVTKSARAGFSTFGASLSLEHSRVECSSVDVDFESKYLDATGAAIGENEPTVADRGQNACGCGVLTTCLAQSAGLAPIKSL